MKDKYLDQNDEFLQDEEKGKLYLSKQENELFHENSYVPHDLISVRRIALPKNGVNWEIYKNKESVLTVKGIRFSKKEREFLNKIDGLQFLITGYKRGFKSISDFTREIKKCLKHEDK